MSPESVLTVPLIMYQSIASIPPLGLDHSLLPPTLLVHPFLLLPLTQRFSQWGAPEGCWRWRSWSLSLHCLFCRSPQPGCRGSSKGTPLYSSLLPSSGGCPFPSSFRASGCCYWPLGTTLSCTGSLCAQEVQRSVKSGSLRPLGL